MLEVPVIVLLVYWLGDTHVYRDLVSCPLRLHLMSRMTSTRQGALASVVQDLYIYGGG
jgi:hypothetical protein